nr:triacylglycerol lipase (EC 3.1.1.3) precursor 1 - Rhizomucor miehei [Rhizomucor miehei]
MVLKQRANYLGFLIVFFTAFLVEAVPIKRQSNSTVDSLPPLIPSRTSAPSSSPSTTDPEAPAMSRNGPLPSDVETKYGMALNATSYPDSVVQAMSIDGGIRAATSQEINELTYYTTLSANSYCRTVIPGATWDCIHCDATEDLKIIKTWSTLIYDTNAMVARGDSEKTIYIVFRGSSSIRNWIADLTFVPVSYPPVSGTKVHKGFLDSYGEVQNELVATVLDQFKQYPSYKVAVTGHSLGGATALLCALGLYQREEGLSSSNLFLYTQGQPRVGDPAFANYVVSTGIPYRRTVNERDIVPHLPPAAFGFLHAGEEYWITDNSPETVQVCTSDLETSDCSNSIVPFTSVLDHLSYFGINTGLCT